MHGHVVSLESCCCDCLSSNADAARGTINCGLVFEESLIKQELRTLGMALAGGTGSVELVVVNCAFSKDLVRNICAECYVPFGIGWEGTPTLLQRHIFVRLVHISVLFVSVLADARVCLCCAPRCFLASLRTSSLVCVACTLLWSRVVVLYRVAMFAFCLRSLQSVAFYNALAAGKPYDISYMDARTCEEKNAVTLAAGPDGHAMTTQPANPVFFELPNHAEVCSRASGLVV
jgi:hypothetical protein